MQVTFIVFAALSFADSFVSLARGMNGDGRRHQPEGCHWSDVECYIFVSFAGLFEQTSALHAQFGVDNA